MTTFDRTTALLPEAVIVDGNEPCHLSTARRGRTFVAKLRDSSVSWMLPVPLPGAVEDHLHGFVSDVARMVARNVIDDIITYLANESGLNFPAVADGELARLEHERLADAAIEDGGGPAWMVAVAAMLREKAVRW